MIPGRSPEDFLTLSVDDLKKNVPLLYAFYGYFGAEYAATGKESARLAFLRAADAHKEIFGPDRETSISRSLMSKGGLRKPMYIEGLKTQVRQPIVYKTDLGIPMIAALVEHYGASTSAEAIAVGEFVKEYSTHVPRFDQDLSSQLRLLAVVKASDGGAKSVAFRQFAKIEERFLVQTEQLDALVPSFDWSN